MLFAATSRDHNLLEFRPKNPSAFVHVWLHGDLCLKVLPSHEKPGVRRAKPPCLAFEHVISEIPQYPSPSTELHLHPVKSQAHCSQGWHGPAWTSDSTKSLKLELASAQQGQWPKTQNSGVAEGQTAGVCTVHFQG